MLKLTIKNTNSHATVVVSLPVEARVTIEHRVVMFIGMDGNSLQTWTLRRDDVVRLEYILQS